MFDWFRFYVYGVCIWFPSDNQHLEETSLSKICYRMQIVFGNFHFIFINPIQCNLFQSRIDLFMEVTEEVRRVMWSILFRIHNSEIDKKWPSTMEWNILTIRSSQSKQANRNSSPAQWRFRGVRKKWWNFIWFSCLRPQLRMEWEEWK